MLLAKPPSCQPCPLWTDGVGFTEPEGQGSLGVVIVLEAPGRSERNDGKPARPYADAGSVLEDVIRLGGWSRHQFAIWNTIGCQPGRMERGAFVGTNELEGAPYEQAAIAHCQRHLDMVVERYAPRCILALGNVPLKALTGMCGKKQTVTFVRGFALHSERYNLPVVASYHPSFLRRGAMHLKGVLRRDLDLAVRIASKGLTAPATDYSLYPSGDEAEMFARLVESHPEWPISYDIETRWSEGENEDELEEGPAEITQIQFSVRPGQAIVFPWVEPYVGVARRVLATPNVKWGQNIWAFDNPILTVNGCPVAGESIDTMWMWHHLQPDLPRNLQFITSFYAPELGPWKHLADKDLAFYGALDVDSVQRIMQRLPGDLRKAGVWRGYEEHVLRLWPILKRMSERGLPVDREAQARFRVELDATLHESFGRMQELVPDQLKNCLPKEGYKNEKIALKQQAANGLEAGEKWVRRVFDVRVVTQPSTGDINGVAPGVHEGSECNDYVPRCPDTSDCTSVERWVRLQPFKPSSLQLMSYMKHRGHRIPKIPGEEKETTGKLGIQRLLKSTKDPLYKHVLDYREAEKMKGAYLEGWRCGDDGRIHAEFTFSPATGQLAARNPNVMTLPKRVNLAKAFRGIIAARPGHQIVSLDYSAFHVLTLGFEAQDADYMRWARLDIHSLMAATQLLKVEKLDVLNALPDAELLARLNWWRANKERTWTTSDGEKTFKWVRDFRAKPGILGRGLGLGAKHLYEQNLESFSSQQEAKSVLDAIDAASPKTTRYRDDIRRIAQQRKFLLSKHGYIRWFWDVMTWDSRNRRWKSGADSEAAIAFLVQNDAHGHLKDAMLRMEAHGWLERYGCVNVVHDDVWFECPDGLVGECMENVRREMERPSTVLVDPVVAPGGLTCGVSVSVGPNLGEMRDVETK